MSVESPIRKTDHWFIGADATFLFPVVNAAGTPVNLTGATLEFVLRDMPNGTVIFTRTSAAAQISIVNSAATADAASVAIPAALTILAGVILIQPGKYHYTLRKTNAGDAQPLAFGYADLLLGDTR